MEPDDAALVHEHAALTYIKEISPRPVLLIHGEKAHSRYFSETAYAAAVEPKELMIIPAPATSISTTRST